MVPCSLCNAATSLEEGTTYTTEELEQATARGFGPPDSAVQAALAAGWTREQAMRRWRERLTEGTMVYWLLCPACAARAARYLPQTGGAGLAPTPGPDRETPRYVPKTPTRLAPPSEAPPAPWLAAEPVETVPAAPAEPAPWGGPEPAASTPAAGRPAIRRLGDRAAKAAPAPPSPPPGPPPAAQAPSGAAEAVPLPPGAGRVAPPAAAGRARDPLLVLVVVLAVGLAIGAILLFSSRAGPGPAPTPAVTTRPPTPLPTRTPGPTRVWATPRPSPTLSETALALIQTRTALEGLTGVLLRTGDLPAGLQPMTPAELSLWELTGGSLERPWDGTIRALPHHVAGFANTDRPPAFTYVVTMLAYPLGEEEQVSLDRALSDPLSAISLSACLPAVTGRSRVAPLPGGDRFAEKSAGMTMLGDVAGKKGARVDAVIVRRGTIVEIVLVAYLEGTSPPVTALQVAEIFDARLVEALGGAP